MQIDASGDTKVSPGTADAVLSATATLHEMGEQLIGGKIERVFALLRPPGKLVWCLEQAVCFCDLFTHRLLVLQATTVVEDSTTIIQHPWAIVFSIISFSLRTT